MWNSSKICNSLPHMSFDSTSPRWLRFLERKLQWLAIPNIAILLVTLQVMGFLMTLMNPIWFYQLALDPRLVLGQGEYWRLITFLALPLSTSPIWILFSLWFLYFIVNTIETHWGAFRTTLYVLVSILITIAFSLTTLFPISQATDFESTLFLAAAMLYPEMEIRLYMAIPVKMKWLAWLSLGYLGFRFFESPWIYRFYLLAIYSNFFIFFGPAAIGRIRQYIRREQFRRRMR